MNNTANNVVTLYPKGVVIPGKPPGPPPARPQTMFYLVRGDSGAYRITPYRPMYGDFIARGSRVAVAAKLQMILNTAEHDAR